MPFCAIPNNILDIVTRKRVVTNELNVLEFALARETNSMSRTSTLSTVTKKNKRFSSSSSQKQNQTIQYQSPMLASPATSNPFHESRFPVYTYYLTNNGRPIFYSPILNNKSKMFEVLPRALEI